MTTISAQIKQIPSFVIETNNLSHKIQPKNDPYQPLIAIYLLRLALGLKNQLPANAIANLVDEAELGIITGLAPSLVAKAADEVAEHAFQSPIATEEEPIYGQFNQQLTHLLNQGMQVTSPLFANIQNIADEFRLSPAEQELLVLSLLMASNPKFNAYLTEYCSATVSTTIADYLCLMTHRSIEEIKRCLKPTATLIRMGWLDVIEHLDPSRLLVPPNLLYRLFNKLSTKQQLSHLFFKHCPRSTLTAEAYPQLMADLDVVIPYLQNALARRTKGVNLLIYGTSAPGKRELAKLIAKLADTQLFAVCNQQFNANDLEPEDRFIACLTTQVWLRQYYKSELILIDQADAIFSPITTTPTPDQEENVTVVGVAPKRLKQQLSENPVPIIWIIKKPNHIAAELLRRFDYALEVEKMPEAFRHQRIVKTTQDLELSTHWQQQLAKRTDIPLHHIKKGAAIARLSKNNVGLTSEQIIGQVLESQSRLYKQPTPFQHAKSATAYDLQFTNTSIALTDLVTGLKRRPCGRFCFYGAPGTGKTAFAKYLAEQLTTPIVIKRASDIFNKYIGESEKNMAKMFREAKADGAILLIDEADTFLSNRSNAHHNWEISKTNEMLVQMEDFEGIFICTTNLMHNIDSASLRRFDFKVKFDYLNAEQRWTLFTQESQRLGVHLPDDAHALQTLQQQIQRLTKLTPGDFAVVNRQSSFQVQPFTINDMFNSLQQECIAKGEQFSSIGFVQ